MDRSIQCTYGAAILEHSTSKRNYRPKNFTPKMWLPQLRKIEPSSLRPTKEIFPGLILYNLVFLQDFEYFLFPDLNPNYYGMLDQLIASMGDVFFGTYYSTFTGYINRMRGYHSQNKKAYGHQVGMIDSYYIKLKLGYNYNESGIMRTYSAVEPPFWRREFPVCWRDIDHDVVIWTRETAATFYYYRENFSMKY